MCLRSRRLRRHTISENIQLNLLLPLPLVFFFFFILKKFTVCQHNQHILWKRKFSLNRFFLFIWGPGIEIFYLKKISKISWHCPFKRTFRVNTVVWFLFWWRSHFRYSLHTVHSAHTCRRKSVSRNWTLVVSSSGREVHCTLYTVQYTSHETAPSRSISGKLGRNV